MVGPGTYFSLFCGNTKDDKGKTVFAKILTGPVETPQT